VLSGGRLQAAGETDDLLAGHCLLTGPAGEADRVAELFTVIEMRRAAAQAHLMVRTSGPDGAVPPGWEPPRSPSRNWCCPTSGPSESPFIRHGPR
jgi:ABC-2 type transport system ATP-binding protein